MMPQAPAGERRPYDVVIVGAGISGIGMAAQLARQCPDLSYVLIDRRMAPGGTWDLFRYPGIRSDSDIHTFGYAHAPWREDQSVVSGAQIRDYLGRVIAENGIAPNMRFGLRVDSADWHSKAAVWTLNMQDQHGAASTVTARFLVMGTGYYDHDNPHRADIAGLDSFAGTVIHPQFWPEDFDADGKRIVVIGSGATAVTLIPALAERGAQVTMLQRTPTWYGIQPSTDRLALRLRRWLPERWAWGLNRLRAQRMHEFLFRRARSDPKGFGALLQSIVRRHLKDKWNPADYTPPYGPWEQRLCLVPDGDMFRAIRKGQAQVVTATIRQVTPAGIELDDGRVIEADVIVTATGLSLATLGKVAISIDGQAQAIPDHYWYRDCMLSNVPNMAAIFGYLNAGWTLRVDLVTDYLCRLLRQMKAWDMAVVTPALPADHDLVEDQPVDMFSSGYLQRGKHLIPKSATTAPWRLQMDYRTDRAEFAATPIDDGWLKFERRPRH